MELDGRGRNPSKKWTNSIRRGGHDICHDTLEGQRHLPPWILEPQFKNTVITTPVSGQNRCWASKDLCQVTSQTPQRLRFEIFSLSASFSSFSICSEKKVSKIRYTSLVVVALVGPLSLSILVGCRMACLLAARLEEITEVKCYASEELIRMQDTPSENTGIKWIHLQRNT